MTLKNTLRRAALWPPMTSCLEIITLGQGIQVRCADQWPLRIRWRRRLELNFKKWEREFVEVFIGNLRQDDIVFDVGAENGEWAALVATRIGGGRIHLFEPNAAIWSHIRRIWKLNDLAPPGGCCRGFVGERRSEPIAPATSFKEWPQTNRAGPVRFESLLESSEIGTITLDDYVQATEVVPTIIKMDIEGAELTALRGAAGTLAKHKPTVFLSLHPWLLSQFQCEASEVQSFFDKLGYRQDLLSTDHEEHWVMWDPAVRDLRIPAPG